MKDNQVDTRSLKKSIFFTITIISVFLTLIIYILMDQIQDNKFDNLKIQQEVNLNSSINNIMDSYVSRYSSTLHRLIKTQNIVQMFNNLERDKLYKLLKPQWDIIKQENPFITVMHFHKSNGISFLRMHQPNKYDDDIASIRPMLQTIHKEHKVIKGYETGLYAIVYRIIYPVFDNGKYIGALEIGINPNGFIDSINKFSNVNGVLFIKNQYLKLYKKDINIQKGEYTLQSNINKKEKEIIESLPDNYQFLKYDTSTNTDQEYILHSVPIVDYEKKNSSKFIIFL